MKNYRTYLGIDVGKLTLDYCVVTEDQQLEIGQVLNTQRSLNLFLKNLKNSGHDLKEMLFVFENTGIYSSLLYLVLNENELVYGQIHALEIKRSLWITRAKCGKIFDN